MSVVTAVLLGLVQGLTEFLPVSSSGHLVLSGHLLGLREPHLLFDVVVHTATLVATATFYRSTFAGILRDLARAAGALVRGERAMAALGPGSDLRLLGLVVVGSAPTAAVGLVFEAQLAELFQQPRVAAAMLLVTAGLLMGTRFARSDGRTLSHMRVVDALLIGAVQGLAIIPGVSRSGSTIACALFLGLDRDLSARFSFLLSVPAILGALILHTKDGIDDWSVIGLPLFCGFACAAVVGIVALTVLIPLVRSGRLHFFAFYLVPVGALGVFLLP